MKIKEILEKSLILTQSNLNENTEVNYKDLIERINILSRVIEGLFGEDTPEKLELFEP